MEASVSCAHQPEDKGKGSRKTQTRVGAIHGQVASPPLFHYAWESISSINQPAHELCGFVKTKTRVLKKIQTREKPGFWKNPGFI